MTTIAPAQPAPVPAPVPAAAVPAPLPYHRLSRAFPSSRWWRPLTTIAVALAAYAVMLLALLVPTVVVGLTVPVAGAALDRALSLDTMDFSDPVTLAAVLATWAIAIPAVQIGVRLGGWRLIGSVSSIAGRLRWGLLGRCLALATLLLATGHAVTMLADPAVPGPELSWTARSGWILAAALLLVPLQAAGEEYVFRGLLMQSLGAWLRHPAWAILLPVPLFVIGHDYSWTGQLDVAVFAIAAAYLTWRTSGLEAAIALHVINNSLIVAAGAVGLADLNATSIPIGPALISVTFTVLYVVLVLRARSWWSPAARPARTIAIERS